MRFPYVMRKAGCLEVRDMKWIAGAVVLSSLIMGYAINYPYNSCVSGYLEQSNSNEGLAKLACYTKGS